MKKSILVFTNGEKIGDGLIKLPLLHEIKRRFPNYKLIWLTNIGTSAYNDRLKNISMQYIDEIYEQANLNIFIWNKISNKYNLEEKKIDIIIDTQKSVLRTLALKRIKTKKFISFSFRGLLSKPIFFKQKGQQQYYFKDLIELLNYAKKENYVNDFKFPIPKELENRVSKIFLPNSDYIGYALGAGEKNRIWNLDNFIEVINYFEKKNYKSVFFLGPNEKEHKEYIKKKYNDAIFPEELIQNFSGPEVVIASTKFLSCALCNDSGIGHMLSTNLSPLIKLFGHHDSRKFTPNVKNLHSISSQSYGSKNINRIPVKDVIIKMEETLIEN